MSELLHKICVDFLFETNTKSIFLIKSFKENFLVEFHAGRDKIDYDIVDIPHDIRLLVTQYIKSKGKSDDLVYSKELDNLGNKYVVVPISSKDHLKTYILIEKINQDIERDDVDFFKSLNYLIETIFTLSEKEECKEIDNTSMVADFNFNPEIFDFPCILISPFETKPNTSFLKKFGICNSIKDLNSKELIPAEIFDIIKESKKFSDSYILDFPEESYQVILSKNQFGTVLQLLPIDNIAVPKIKNETYNFFSGLSHELRTPLNSIMGYSQILSSNPGLSAENQNIVQHIRQSSETLLQLINDLLDFSRINSGNYQQKTTEIPSMAFFERTIKKAFEEASSNIEQFVKIDSNLPQVLIGDKSLLNRIITAVIANAIKNTQRGFVRAELFLIGKTEEKAIIKFEVSDSGNGFKEDELKILLNQSDMPLQSKILYAYKRIIKIVRFLGGRVYMDSKVQTGTNFGFVIELPYKRNAGNRNNLYSDIVTYDGPTKKILIVDDDFKNRLLLTTVLSPIGFEIKEAENGIEAIRIAQNFVPDMVLIDYFMPGINGIEAAKKIQNISEEIKFLIITGRDLETQGDDLIYDYILKPYDFNILFDKIKEYLNLNWVYEQQDSDSLESTQIVIYPGRKVLVNLYQYALIGDIKSLTAILDKLEADDSKYTAFTQRIREYAAKFKMKSIREMLRPNIDEL